MPINGLSEVRRLPRMGKIRLGIKLKKGNVEYPKEVDYFILDPSVENEDERKRLIDIFHQKYGEKPKQIPIMFPVPNQEAIFPQYYKRYGQSTLLQCRGDGIEAVCSQEEFTAGLEKTGKDEFGLTKVKCAGKECPYYKERKCSAVGVLSVLLPELPGSGVWQIVTGSINSILNINSCLDYIKALAGRFHMIPLMLERREIKIQHEGKARIHWVLHLDLKVSIAELQKLATIDPERIALELPTIDEEKEDILFLENKDINPSVEDAQIVQPSVDKNAEKLKEIMTTAKIIWPTSKTKFQQWLFKHYETMSLEEITEDKFDSILSKLCDIKDNPEASKKKV